MCARSRLNVGVRLGDCLAALCPFTDAPRYAVWVGLTDGRLLWIDVDTGNLLDQAFVHPQAVR